MSLKRSMAGLLAFVIIFNIIAGLPMNMDNVQSASNVPGINAKVTKNNVLKILNRYDKDGAYILKKQIAKGDDILSYYSGGNRIIDALGVTVHEETHGYYYSYAKNKKMAYFVGGKKTVYVPRTKVFSTKKTASSVPKSLRTLRYDKYIAKPPKNLAANVNGVYGLLNEFMAYRASMNTSVSLFSYYADKNADWDVWQRFIWDCESGKTAYAEFKFYILHYLSYAKKHQPKIYKAIVKNKKFCEAYRKIESSYAKLIRTYEQDLKKLRNILAEKGYMAEVTDDEVYVETDEHGTSVVRYTREYQKIQNELNKTKYKSIHKKLVK